MLTVSSPSRFVTTCARGVGTAPGTEADDHASTTARSESRKSDARRKRSPNQMSDPYRTPPKAECWAVEMRVRCPAPFHYARHTMLLEARDEDDAVNQVFQELERQGFEVVACIDAHRVWGSPTSSPALEKP